MMPGKEARVYLGCLARSYFIVSAYNQSGLQNIAFLYAIDPALRLLHGGGKSLREARLRYARNYNCHPFFTPMFLGLLLRMEKAIAEGRIDVRVLSNIKDTTGNTLSAIGDSLFNGSLLVFWALVTACLALAKLPGEALIFSACAFGLLQLFKLASFLLGLRMGMSVLLLLRRVDLINWSERIKTVNAALLALFLWLALPGATAFAWSGVAFTLLCAVWLVGKLHVARFAVALALLALAAFWRQGGWFF